MFRESIQNMIKQYEGDLLLISRLEPLCICAKNGTNEPDEKCSICFGTGRKISIRGIKGVVQESNGASTMRKNSDFTVTKEIFIDAKYKIMPEDLIVFEKQVFKTYQVKMHRLSNNDKVYQIVYATPLKYDSCYILKHLEKLGVRL